MYASSTWSNCLPSSSFPLLFQTQAATGATTGDWLVKFYAPWCSHCKRLEPVWEEVATQLKQDPDNYVNVAKVDCDAHRGVGGRFDIKAFPTIKMISKGKVYTYTGKKNVEDILYFAKGDFRFEESDDVPKDLGIIGEIIKIVKHAYKSALSDIEAGKYFTKDVFFIALPFLFGSSILLILMLPVDNGPSASVSMRNEKLRKKK